jgi:HSP20 family protein
MTDALQTLDQLRSEVQSLFDRAERRDAPGLATWSPRVDIYETPDAIRLDVDLPGMQREDVHIELTHDSLTISGERKLEKRAEGEETHRTERVAGPFSRSFSIGVDIDPAKTTARLVDGVLTLTIAKAPHATPRTIEINAE